MKRFVSAIPVLAITLLAYGAPPTALAVDGGTVSNAAVSTAGLKVQWLTQVSTGIRGRIIDVHFNVNENRSTTFYEVLFGRGREVISQHDLDAFGNPRGIEGAQEFAELRKEIISKELAARGMEETEVTIQRYTLPASTLYVLTSDGYVVAIDADTGKTKWSHAIGSREHPTIGIGASNDYVAAVNGTRVYCMEAETGKTLFVASAQTSVSSSPAVSDGFVYVPLTSGRVEVFAIGNDGVGSERYIGQGRALSRPTVTENSICWTTTAGHLNVAQQSKNKTERDEQAKRDADEQDAIDNTFNDKEKAELQLRQAVKKRIKLRNAVTGITYRLRTNDEFVSAAAYKGGKLYVTSLGGFIYAIDEKHGRIEWEFSTGDEIESSPHCIGNHIYVTTTTDALFKLDARTGARVWEQELRGIRTFIGASKDRIYVLDHRGDLLVLNPENGQRLGQVSLSGVDLVYPNTISDRMFVGSTNGMIQCLAETSSRIPHFHSADFEEAMTEKKPVEDTDDTSVEADADDDPFKDFDAGGDMESDNPFGNSDDDSDDNPFGAAEEDEGDNPFGGSEDDDDDENPFGGSEDEDDDENPFGGG